MAEEIQIKACPFCGNTEVGMAGKSFRNFCYCNACRTMGPDQETEAEAIRLWNQAGRVEAAKATPFQESLLAQADRIERVATMMLEALLCDQESLLAQADRIERVATMMLEALLCDRAGCTERADFLERAASNSISDILIELAKPRIGQMFGTELVEKLDAVRVAAADLLEACEATVTDYDGFVQGLLKSAHMQITIPDPACISKCRAAIAKARDQEARA